ncbi:MAG: (4Fe-4S)-binding protein [Actinobacteria bacterium]|nr:(4Fe-4S)-binding protein [Actinomycetota bacterium]MBM3712629.1 (4Fe-4S)-binding protein [Actinomycetota bacterium]
MKQITIISGKGGTGKTTVASNFIKMAHDHVAVDADVDAANLHILLEPKVEKKEDFIGGEVAVVNESCINCGKCEELCRFDAILNSTTDIKIDSLKCEGCGVCEYICPASAIGLVKDKQGEFYVSSTNYCSLVHARLDPGAENSGLLVTRVRNAAEDIAYSQNKKLIIIDGAPGIGCPVIASLNGVDYALIVTEPTLSGISDFKKIYGVAMFFNIKTFVIINKFDINTENTAEIEKFCHSNDIEIIGRISYDEMVPKVLPQKKFIIDFPDSPAGIEIRQLYEKFENALYN